VPYSNFPVGAAVVADDGQIYDGCNIESASYGLTCCAERVGMFNAIAHGAKPVGLAVTCLKGDLADPNSLTPCGACRQVMLDLMGAEAPVIIDRLGEFTVGDLLPKGFQLPG
jgi:cytidine deaminase